MKRVLSSFKTKLFFLSVFVFLFCIPKAFSNGPCEGAFLAPILLRKIEHTSLSPRIQKTLKQSGRNLVYVGDVANLTEKELRSMGFSPKAVNTIKQFLLENGTHLNTERRSWITRHNWPLTEEQQRELKNKLAFMDIERMAEPEAVEVLKTIWMAEPEARHFDDPKEMMKALKDYRDDINNVESFKRRLNELETQNTQMQKSQNAEDIRKLMDDLSGLKERVNQLENLEAMRTRVSNLERLKKILEPPKVKLTPVFVQPVSQLFHLAYIYSQLRAFFKAHDIVYIGDLVTLKEWELFEILNYSDHYLLDVKKALSIVNLHLGMQIEGWRPSTEKIEELREVQRLSREGRKTEENRDYDIRKLEYVFVVPVVEILNNIRNALGNRLTEKVEEIFAQENIVYIGDLVSRTEQQLLAIPGIGPVIVNEIKRALSRKEKFERNRIFFSGTLHLGMQIEGWRPSAEKIKEVIEQEASGRRSERYHRRRGR